MTTTTVIFRKLHTSEFLLHHGHIQEDRNEGDKKQREWTWAGPRTPVRTHHKPHHPRTRDWLTMRCIHPRAAAVFHPAPIPKDTRSRKGTHTLATVKHCAYGDESTALTGENKPRILLMGLRRSGKSSIQRVVFHKMSPHETLFLEGTNSLDIKYIANNSFVQFQIWDFPGDYDFNEDLVYGGQLVNEEMIFGNCGSIVFVIDAQDEPYTEALSRLHETVIRAHRYNPDIFFEVFIHKVDGDLFLSDDHKIDCQREIQQQITDELSDGELDIHMSFYLTRYAHVAEKLACGGCITVLTVSFPFVCAPRSIYDHSIFEAFSKVVQKLIPQLPTLENLLNILITSCNMEKSFLFDVVSKVYIATDSNPVDMQSYELCSDMIDVVIDVSCIYGMKDDGDGDGLAYDSESSSVIKLNNGMVLYLREVNNYLALVCLLRAENFMKQGVIDYNIDCFKSAIGDVFKVPEKNRIMN